MPLSVKVLPASEYREALSGFPDASIMQYPGWAAATPGRRSVLLGWADGTGRVVGAARADVRRLPGSRWSTASLPEGPVLPWDSVPFAAWADPLVDFLRSRRVFQVRVSPDVPARRWRAATLRAAVSAGGARVMADVRPDELHPRGLVLEEELAAAGWRLTPEGDPASSWARCAFGLDTAGRDLDAITADMGRLWRRSMRELLAGAVSVERGGAELLGELQRLHTATGRYQGFGEIPLPVLQRLFAALEAEPALRPVVYVGRIDGEAMAAKLSVATPRRLAAHLAGTAADRRDRFTTKALDCQAVLDVREGGLQRYDLRGVADTLDPAHPKFGLLNYKLGMGGDVVQRVGEWHLPLSRPLDAAFTALVVGRQRWKERRAAGTEAAGAPTPAPSPAGAAASSPGPG